jgi:hypothetical protein
MSSESVCQVARSWVDVGSFHMRLFEIVYFAIASVREFLDTPSYKYCFKSQTYSPHADAGGGNFRYNRNMCLRLSGRAGSNLQQRTRVVTR